MTQIANGAQMVNHQKFETGTFDFDASLLRHTRGSARVFGKGLARKRERQHCVAQLLNTDVPMSDEPTGRLDVDNIKRLEVWLESYQGSVIHTSLASPLSR